jgi:hypothetical protein
MKDRVETLSAVLLAVAAVTTAWCSYQATRWNAEATIVRGTTQKLRFEADRAQGLAEAETQIDVATFIQWVDASTTHDEQLADFYYARFRAEFKPAVDAWIATDPMRNPDAPLTPFAMPEYVVAASEQAQQFDQQAEASSEVSHVYIQRATDYALGVVLGAVALFLAGMSTKLSRQRLRVAILVTGFIVYAGTMAWIVSMPISFAV